MSSLAGKVALVTGGSKGIGAALALHLAGRGAKVAVNYSSDSKAADEIVAKINAMSEAIAIQADAGSVQGAEEMVKHTVDVFGKIDIVVPMAGIMLMKTLAQTSEQDFDRSYDLNVKGPYFLAQKAVPHMRAGGRIIFISTSVCNLSTVSPGYLLYTSTKGAIEQIARIMAKDLGTKGINVNCVAPGPTATELFFQGKSEQVVQAIANLSPYHKIGEPDDVAAAVGFFCAEESRWVTGQTLRVNGGMT